MRTTQLRLVIELRADTSENRQREAVLAALRALVPPRTQPFCLTEDHQRVYVLAVTEHRDGE